MDKDDIWIPEASEPVAVPPRLLEGLRLDVEEAFGEMADLDVLSEQQRAEAGKSGIGPNARVFLVPRACCIEIVGSRVDRRSREGFVNVDDCIMTPIKPPNLTSAVMVDYKVLPKGGKFSLPLDAVVYSLYNDEAEMATVCLVKDSRIVHRCGKRQCMAPSHLRLTSKAEMREDKIRMKIK
jgi:hypothetical protein